MSGGTTRKIEATVAAGAAATLAGAVGFAAFSALQGAEAYALGTIAPLVAFLGCWRLLSKIGRNVPDYPMPVFDPGAIAAVQAAAHATPAEEPLELVDVLPRLDADSRVVRLFDPAAMPSPGELKARIDRHLERGPPQGADASQALVDALTELRLSLR